MCGPQRSTVDPSLHYLHFASIVALASTQPSLSSATARRNTSNRNLGTTRHTMLPPPSPPRDRHNTSGGSQSTSPSPSPGAGQPFPPLTKDSQENSAHIIQDQTSRILPNQAGPTSHALESAKASAMQAVVDRTRPLASVANLLDSLAFKADQISPATAFAFHTIRQCAIDLTHALALNELQVPANFPRDDKIPPALAPQRNQRPQAPPPSRSNTPTRRPYSEAAKAATLTPPAQHHSPLAHKQRPNKISAFSSDWTQHPLSALHTPMNCRLSLAELCPLAPN